MAGSTYDHANKAAAAIRGVLPEELQHPHIAIVCGSGLSGLQYTIEAGSNSPRLEIEYKDIPHFPRPTVEGHEGKLVFGVMGNKAKIPVVLLVGRVHFYEGHPIDAVPFATRVCRCLDAQILILTNAAGGLNKNYAVGDLMLLSDHINLPGLSGAHPLTGPNDAAIGPRFPPLSDAYDLDLRRRAHRVWRASLHAPAAPHDHPGAAPRSQRRLHEGTYCFAAGPTYETRAEARFLGAFADAVGMSTVPEVVVARHAGMRVLAASLVTNSVVLDPVARGDDAAFANMSRTELEAHMAQGRAGHAEVVEEGARAAEALVGLVRGVVEDLALDGTV